MHFENVLKFENMHRHSLLPATGFPALLQCSAAKQQEKSAFGQGSLSPWHGANPALLLLFSHGDNVATLKLPQLTLSR